MYVDDGFSEFLEDQRPPGEAKDAGVVGWRDDDEGNAFGFEIRPLRSTAGADQGRGRGPNRFRLCILGGSRGQQEHASQKPLYRKVWILVQIQAALKAAAQQRMAFWLSC